MKKTRFAILIREADGKTYWNCQGLPKDPSDFGFAVLYPSLGHAGKFLAGKGAHLKRWGMTVEVVPVICEYPEPIT